MDDMDNDHEMPMEFRIKREECIFTEVDPCGMLKLFDPILGGKNLYNGPLAVLNGFQPVSYFSFHNKGDFERNLVKTSKDNNVRCIPLIENLWVVFKDDIYLKHAMYILSLFSTNPVDYEVADYIKHILDYNDKGINPYDYIHNAILGYPQDEIRGIMLQKYLTHMLSNSDNSDYENIDTIFFDPDIFDNVIVNESKQMKHSGDIIQFDAIFEYISFECDRMLEQLFSSSGIFSTFVKENKKLVQDLPNVRIEVDVPVINEAEVKDLTPKSRVYSGYTGYSGYNYYSSMYSQYQPVHTPKKKKKGWWNNFWGTPTYNYPVHSYHH